jgi:hypothetical protein
MKKYVIIGLAAGTAISLLLFYLRRRQDRGFEFSDFADSETIADDLFGNAFREPPDKI